MAEVEAFDPIMVRELTILSEENNLYATLRLQEKQSQDQIKALTKILHDIKHGKVKPDQFIVPYGMGGYRRLTINDKKELLDTYLKQLEIEENKLKGLIGQRQHRADEVGERRLKILRMLWSVLITQHGFKDTELYEHMVQYTTGQVAYIRPLEDIEKTIQKAGEIIV